MSYTPDPPPPVAYKPILFEEVEPGVGQDPPLGRYSWSPDLTPGRDVFRTFGIKYTARPPERP